MMTTINLETLREARAFLYVLNNISGTDSIRCDISDLKSIKTAINDFFASIKYKSKNPEQYSDATINKVNELLNQKMVSNDDIKKISHNDRVCYFSLMLMKEKYNSTVFLYGYPELNHQPKSSKEIKEYIEMIIDGSPKDKNEKLIAINEIDNLYRSLTSQHQKSFQWLDKKNKEQCDWAYNYTCQKLKNHHVKPNTFSYHQNPQTPEEKYLFSIGTFDLCIFDDPTKKAKYIDLMKGAWEQKTYRKKAKTKKKIGVNLYINEEIKQKLNEIAKKRNIKTTALIEEMIENEHKKTFKTEKSMNNEWSFLI